MWIEPSRKPPCAPHGAPTSPARFSREAGVCSPGAGLCAVVTEAQRAGLLAQGLQPVSLSSPPVQNSVLQALTFFYGAAGWG